MEMNEVLMRAKKFAAEIQPLSRSQQLAWFGQKLSIQPEILLRLIGYSDEFADKFVSSGRCFYDLANQKQKETLWITELFREIVSRGQYNVEQLAHEISLPPVYTSDDNNLLHKIGMGGPSVYINFVDYIRIMKHKGVSLEEKLGILSMKFRSDRNETNRTQIAKQYENIVHELIKSGKWEEMPSLEDMLPDEYMPECFYGFWSIKKPTNTEHKHNKSIVVFVIATLICCVWLLIILD